MSAISAIPKPAVNPRFIAMAVSIATFMEVLDSLRQQQAETLAYLDGF